MSCPAGKQYYVCYKGNFRGCCSTDPCTDGICPDEDGGEDQDDNDDEADADEIPTIAVSSAPVPSTSALDSSSSSAIQTTLTTSTSSSTTTPAASTATSTSGAGSASTSDSGSGSSNSALIGGVVGGVVAALLILGIVLCLFYRRRKKQGKRFTLLRASPRGDEGGDEKGDERQITSMRNVAMGVGNEADNTNTHGATPSTTVTSPVKPLSSESSSPETSFTMSNRTSNTTSTSTAYQSLPPIPPSSDLLAPVPATARADLTPELGDTGFYRPRAELAGTSQSELINVPPESRKKIVASRNTDTNKEREREKETLKPSPNLRPVSPARSDVSSKTPSRGTSPDPQVVKRQTPPVITGEGVVLQPNLDQCQASKRRTGDGHVMSFMQYDSGSENGSAHGHGHEGGHGTAKEGNADEGRLGLGLGLKEVGVDGSESRPRSRS